MSAFVDALLAEASKDDLQRFAERLRPFLSSQAVPAEASRWLTVSEAAEHLRCPKSRIYALVSAKRMPHHKDGSRTLFNRDELDAWIRAGGATRP